MWNLLPVYSVSVIYLNSWNVKIVNILGDWFSSVQFQIVLFVLICSTRSNLIYDYNSVGKHLWNFTLKIWKYFMDFY